MPDHHRSRNVLEFESYGKCVCLNSEANPILILHVIKPLTVDSYIKPLSSVHALFIKENTLSTGADVPGYNDYEETSIFVSGFHLEEQLAGPNKELRKCTHLANGPYAPFGFESIEKQLWRDEQNDRPISDSEIKVVLSRLFKTDHWLPPAGHVLEDVTSHT
ncbi:hypothetical protein AVEN_13311-1 [Araneus ventricosus]|uniref:Uncharacterized protein n=1 Tax=Araneus ventricosus TaxID=182803 RepID=A0A4Y2IK11_ARAVE|nr:hypothetical protein AVEN_13311-1 [Araneus ventricosus]